MDQPTLLEMPEQPEQTVRTPLATKEDKPYKLRLPNRDQSVFTSVHMEDLLAPDHKARAIAALVEKRINTELFFRDVQTREGEAGCWKLDPRMMVAIVLYAYSEGIGSMREVSRLMERDPGLMWLTGMMTISHTTLSDFRRGHKELLDELCAQLLVILHEAGVVDLEQVTLDGTRIRAYGGADTFRTRAGIGKRLAQARAVLEQMERQEASEEINERRRERQRQKKREMIQRLEACEQQFDQQMAEEEEDQGGDKKSPPRRSYSDPEARVMKTSQGGYMPALNVQLLTETKNKVVLHAEVSNVSADSVHLPSMLDALKRLDKKVKDGDRAEEAEGAEKADSSKTAEESERKQVLADGTYITRGNLHASQERKIDLIGPLPQHPGAEQRGLEQRGIDPALGQDVFVWDESKCRFVCPAGKPLEWTHVHQKDRGRQYDVYQAAASDCAKCEHRLRCVGKDESRVLKVQRKDPLVKQHAEKMKAEENLAAYKKRGEVAEFPNAWIKDKLGLRKFHLSGISKGLIEVLWALLAYNLMIWRRLVWVKEPTAVA